MKINAANLRSNIGNVIQWEYAHDFRRGSFLIRSGVIEEVAGKNVRIDGDYKWYPDLINAKILKENA